MGFMIDRLRTIIVNIKILKRFLNLSAREQSAAGEEARGLAWRSDFSCREV